jgi:8-oxo-dGTP pyrophosphatase MutT (NUDIX family)
MGVVVPPPKGVSFSGLAAGTLSKDLRGWLIRSLADPPPRTLPVASDERASAVLLPVILRGDGATLLMVKKSDQLRRHAGQVAFPGGAIDAGETAETAALREAFEEVRLDPATVEIVGQLDDQRTYVTGYHVRPVVGLVRVPPPTFTPDPAEIDAVIELPLAEVVIAEPASWFEWTMEATPHRAPNYEIAGTFVWGASARVLENLLQRLRSSAL